MGFLDLITGGRPKIIQTPPFMPNGRPGMDYAPGNPGLLDLLSGGIEAAGQPGTGSAGMDLMRGLSAGIGSSKQTQDANLKKRIAIMELSRKFENDAILAESRRADAERDKARAQLDLHNASKKPATLQEKFAEAMTLPGMNPEKAMHWAMTGKLPEEAKPGQTVSVTPGAAKAAGLTVSSTLKDVQVPTTDPLNDTRTVPVHTEDPLNLPPSVAGPVMTNWNRINQQGSPGTARPMAPQLLRTPQGYKILNGMNPDGTPNVVETGEGIYEQPMRQRGGGGGGGSNSGGMSKTRATTIENRKNREFTQILADIEKDKDIENNAETYLSRASKTQQDYERAIDINADVPVTWEESLKNLDAVKAAIDSRIQRKISREKVKTEPAKEPSTGDDSVFGAVRRWWNGPTAPPTAPIATNPAAGAPKSVYDPVSRKLVTR